MCITLHNSQQVCRCRCDQVKGSVMMVTIDNFASKLYSQIFKQCPEDEIKEWRLLGQEHTGDLLFSWVQKNILQDAPVTHIGIYDNKINNLEKLYSFNTVVTVIQASTDSEKTFLAFVVKDRIIIENDETQYLYKPYLYKIGSDITRTFDLKLERSKQIMIQFLYTKHSVLTEKPTQKFLVMIHQECILQYQIKDPNETISEINLLPESIVRVFIWAQWDVTHQILFYIHNKKSNKSLVEGEDESFPKDVANKISLTLSGLQFHDELPHESVLNIPLNLPHLHSVPGACHLYEDDAVPLRIHDCSLDLIVLTDSNGVMCICHHYLYQPIQPITDLDDSSSVHFAYSVTVLHQSCVIHCVIPEIKWSVAKTLKPLFSLHGEHLLVFIPEICTHLLDIGLLHEPCCHVTIKPIITKVTPELLCLVPVTSLGKNYVINLATLDLINMSISTPTFIETFKSNTVLENKLFILHYLILHAGEIETASELIAWQAERPFLIGFPQMLKEYLIGTSYAMVQRNLSADATKLVSLLPITTQRTGSDFEVKLENHMISLSQDVLWNASMMLLSPQQRIIPYRSDIWVKLWEQLAKLTKGKKRFKPSQVVEKLIISLVCYQPEVLSRCSTPMSPSASFGSSTPLNDFLNNQSTKRNHIDYLPFLEVETCTASKQEHIISVNLRELSMHLLKQSTENKVGKFQWQLQTPMHVHAIATRYIAAQLDQSRYLCQILCKAATYEPGYDLDKGFVYISNISEERRYILFTVLERYYLAVESIAFPLPQGFTSFFTFLGYKTLSFDLFLQYVKRNVFELQVDVMKIIMQDIDNSKIGIKQKLHILTLLPRSRAKRLLNQWNHPVSLMLRSREHSMNILSGVTGPPTGRHGLPKHKTFKGLKEFPSTETLSPLDSFLDLLTAKASLADIDFNLLVEATETSAEDFLPK